MNHDRKRKKETWICWFFSFFSFVFLPSFHSFVLSQNTLSTPTTTPPLRPSLSKPNERESGPPWSRVARRVERPTRMAQHRFLPSFLSPNSRRPNSTLSSARHIQPCRQWRGAIHCGSTKKDHSNDILVQGSQHPTVFRLFWVFFFGWVSPFHLPRASTFLFVLKLRFQAAYYV